VGFKISGVFMAVTLTMMFCAATMAIQAGAHDIFNGKTITYVVSTKPGGGYDAYARLIAPYLEKYLPGSKVVVRNVPGAGHIIGANQVYAAKPDGQTIITFNTGLIYAQLLGHEGIQFDLRKMSWIGKAAADSRVLLVGNNSSFQSVDDLKNAIKPILLATAGAGSASHNESLFLQKALGFNARIITGYGGNEAELAVLRGEVDGMFGSLSSLKPFVARNQGSFILAVDANLTGIPEASDLVTTDNGRALINLISSQSILGRLTAAPPGIPEPHLSLLREAYARALSDPGLIEQANRLQLPLSPLVGDDVRQKVISALDQPPETLALIRQVTSK